MWFVYGDVFLKNFGMRLRTGRRLDLSVETKLNYTLLSLERMRLVGSKLCTSHTLISSKSPTEIPAPSK